MPPLWGAGAHDGCMEQDGNRYRQRAVRLGGALVYAVAVVIVVAVLVVVFMYTRGVFDNFHSFRNDIHNACSENGNPLSAACQEWNKLR